MQQCMGNYLHQRPAHHRHPSMEAGSRCLVAYSHVQFINCNTAPLQCRFCLSMSAAPAAGMYWGQGTGSVTNCFFISNNATAFGGGMFIDTCTMNIVVSAHQTEWPAPFGSCSAGQPCCWSSWAACLPSPHLLIFEGPPTTTRFVSTLGVSWLLVCCNLVAEANSGPGQQVLLHGADLTPMMSTAGCPVAAWEARLGCPQWATQLVRRCKQLILCLPPLQNTTVEANTATTTGGGIYMQLSTNNIATSSFINNIAKFAAGLFRNGCLGLVSWPPMPILIESRLTASWLAAERRLLHVYGAWLCCAQASSAFALLLASRSCVCG